jgi:hypothetical protein
MLVLWSIADDLGQSGGSGAGRTIGRGDPRSQAPRALRHHVSREADELAVAKVLWEFHQLDVRSTITGAKKAASGQPIRSVAFTGHRTKKVIKKAEVQLGIEAMAGRTRNAQLQG